MPRFSGPYNSELMFFVISFLITNSCCETFRFNECQTPQTIRNTPQALKLSIPPCKQAEKPTDNNNTCSNTTFCLKIYTPFSNTATYNQKWDLPSVKSRQVNNTLTSSPVRTSLSKLISVD